MSMAYRNSGPYRARGTTFRGVTLFSYTIDIPSGRNATVKTSIQRPSLTTAPVVPKFTTATTAPAFTI